LQAASQAEFEQQYAAAEQARQQAAAVGGEWRDVGQMLADAKQAADSGDFAKAVALANAARVQSELGQQQALAQRQRND
jgi:hypothetical protein